MSAAVDEAAEKFERARKSLLRGDGKAKYSVIEHEEMERIARQQFEENLRYLENESASRVERLEARIHLLEHGDPSAALDSQELEAANARRAFVSDEVFSIGPEALGDRVKALIASGDRAGAFVYAHLLRTLAKDAEYGDTDADKLRLQQLVRELEAALDPEAAGRLEKARAEIAELRKLKDYIHLRKNGVTDPVELYLNRAYGVSK